MDITLQTSFGVAGVYTPPADFADDFNRADGPMGSTSTGGRPWAMSLGTGVTEATAGIESNVARILTLTGTGYAACLVDAQVTEFAVEFTVMNTPVVGGRWYLKASDAQNAIVGRVNGSGQLVITRLAPGADANLFASTVPVAVGSVIRAEVTLDAIAVYVNDALVWAGPASLVTGMAATKAGFGAQSASNVGRIDNFSVTF